MPQGTDKIDSKFRFILLAAKRARQLQNGAKPLIHTSSRRPTRVAQEELRAGALQWEMLPLPKAKAEAKAASEEAAPVEEEKKSKD